VSPFTCSGTFISSSFVRKISKKFGKDELVSQSVHRIFKTWRVHLNRIFFKFTNTENENYLLISKILFFEECI